MRFSVRWLVPLFVLALLASCSDDSGGDSADDGVCDYYDVDGCSVYGLVLAEPLPTADALVAIADLPGPAIRVWRTDWACIGHYSMPVGPTDYVPARGAYVDADEMFNRMENAAGSLAPPITGLDSWRNYISAYLQEWRFAQEPGVMVEAVAVYLPDAAAGALAADPRFTSVTLLESSRSESTDASYAGELWVDSVPPLSEVPKPTCEGE